MSDPTESARNYLAKMDPAVSGQGGHGQTFHAACVLVNGFGLTRDESRPLLQEYNLRCQPQWNERDLEHKLTEAEKTVDPKGRGYLRKAKGRTFYANTQQSYTPPAKTADSRSAVHRGKYEIDAKAELPKPIADGCRELIRAVFREGEGIRIVPASLGDDQRELPEGEGHTLTREDWLSKLDAKQGNPNGIFSSAEKTGIYIAVNPLKVGCTKDADVTDYRHTLIEFDDIPLSAQWQLIQKSNIPCAAVIHSGGRSIHAWVKVDAKDKLEYEDRVKSLYGHFAAYGIDGKNRNPSRLSRLPGCVRFDKRQELLSTALGFRDFDTWKDSQETDGWPKIKSSIELIDSETKAPAELVRGVLHRGEKMTLAGTSKSKKTWALIDLALSVTHGKAWWGQETVAGKVLYINFELQNYWFAFRLAQVASALGISPKHENLSYWGLRGKATSIDEMMPKFSGGIRDAAFDLIIIDPIYKALGKRDENAAGDVTDLLNHIERLAVETGAAIVFGAHFSKGNQAHKSSMDRISGSGAFARDADTLITMTEHERKDCLTVEFTLRNFTAKDPFVVQWTFPTFARAGLIDPKRIEGSQQGKKWTDAECAEIFKKALSPDPDFDVPTALPKAKLVKRLMEETGMSKSPAYTRIDEFLTAKKLTKDDAGNIMLS
jgi:RecA-family ATPase